MSSSFNMMQQTCQFNTSKPPHRKCRSFGTGIQLSSTPPNNGLCFVNETETAGKSQNKNETRSLQPAEAFRMKKLINDDNFALNYTELRMTTTKTKPKGEVYYYNPSPSSVSNQPTLSLIEAKKRKTPSGKRPSHRSSSMPERLVTRSNQVVQGSVYSPTSSMMIDPNQPVHAMPGQPNADYQQQYAQQAYYGAPQSMSSGIWPSNIAQQSTMHMNPPYFYQSNETIGNNNNTDGRFVSNENHFQSAHTGTNDHSSLSSLLLNDWSPQNPLMTSNQPFSQTPQFMETDATMVESFDDNNAVSSPGLPLSASTNEQQPPQMNNSTQGYSAIPPTTPSIQPTTGDMWGTLFPLKLSPDDLIREWQALESSQEGRNKSGAHHHHRGSSTGSTLSSMDFSVASPQQRILKEEEDIFRRTM